MSEFRLGDKVMYVGHTFNNLRGLTGIIIGHTNGLLIHDGQYRVEFKSVKGYCYSLLPTSLCLVSESSKVDVTAKPGDKVKFLVEGTIIREDEHPSNWIINAPLFWQSGETRHIRKTSVVEVTESLTFKVGQEVPAEDVHLLPLGAVLSEPWSGLMVVVGDDSLIYMDSTALPFRNIDPDPSDEYYVVVSLPKED